MLRARLSVILAALLFSTGATAIKGASLSALQVSSLRSGIAALALALVVQPWRRSLPPRVWLVGVGYAAVVTLFVVANKLTTAAHTIYLAPALAPDMRVATEAPGREVLFDRNFPLGWQPASLRPGSAGSAQTRRGSAH